MVDFAKIAAPIGALAGLKSLVGDSESSWEDRVKEAAYTPPSGTRIRFDFENVGRGVDKRDAAFQFPGVNDAYVQQNGFGSRRYPLRCIFWGPNCDLLASSFEAALLEPGIGQLEHPLYGKFPAVPFGTITRRDDLTTAANQSIVEVVFWTTTGAVYPSDQRNARNEIVAALNGFDLAAAQQFDGLASFPNQSAIATALATVRRHTKAVQQTMKEIVSQTEEVQQQFDDAVDTLNLAVDALIDQPLQLAFAINTLVKTPARALAAIGSRIAGYNEIISDMLLDAAASPGDALLVGFGVQQRSLQISNDFHVSDLYMSGAVAGSIASSLNAQFETKPAALTAAEAILSQFATVTAWRDDGFGALEDIPSVFPGQVDPATSYQQLQAAVALAAGFLVQVSFDLVPEYQLVLDRPRTIVDLSAELYGEVDQRLDFLIASNDLTGDEILELPRGKLIRYYPPAR